MRLVYRTSHYPRLPGAALEVGIQGAPHSGVPVVRVDGHPPLDAIEHRLRLELHAAYNLGFVAGPGIVPGGPL